MPMVKRYHSPVQYGILTIEKKTPDIADVAASHMTVKTINDSVKPDEILPTLLVLAQHLVMVCKLIEEQC